MKRLLIAILAAVGLIAPVLSPASAQEVSRLNQDMDNRPNLQSEQTVSGRTSAPGVKVQKPQPSLQAIRRGPARASKSPPHFRGSAPAQRVGASKTEPRPSLSNN
jgi:hypothetical protein